MQASRHEACLGDLASDRPVFLAELNLGHFLLDFGQPPILRSALPRRPQSVRVDAQDACVRDLMPSAFIGEANAALSAPFETKITDLPSIPSSSFDTWKPDPLASQPTIELTASEITVATVWFTPL